jgi:hypothetical protein
LRYEVIRMAQFLFSLALIAGAFASGLFLGWYCWGPRRSGHSGPGGPAETAPERDWVSSTQDGRGGLFSPDGDTAAAAPFDEPAVDLTELAPVDLRFGVVPRGELGSTAEAVGPHIGIPETVGPETVGPETLVGESS